jgi:hypothetical protein
VKRRIRFRVRWLGWLLLAVVPFVSPEPRSGLSLDSFADAPAPIMAHVEVEPGAAAPPAGPDEAPGALAGFVAFFTPRFVVRAEPELAEHAELLARQAETTLDDLQRLFGPAPGPVVEIRLVSRSRELARVAPPDSPPPSWATGLTYGDRNLILLALLSERTGRFVPLPAVLRHELAHLVVDRVVRGRPLPRWLDEGLALWAAGDDYAGRSEELLNAALRDKLLPLEALERGYPADEGLVPLAYAQSLDVVLYLADTYGRAPLRNLLREVGAGTPLREAVLDSFGTTIARLEEDWRDGIRVWYRWVPALVSGGTLWGIISLMLAYAYLRQRKRRKELYAQWDREEEAAEHAAVPTPWPDRDPKPHGGIRLAPPSSGTGAKGGTQVVYHDGRYHTLH